MVHGILRGVRISQMRLLFVWLALLRGFKWWIILRLGEFRVFKLTINSLSIKILLFLILILFLSSIPDWVREHCSLSRKFSMFLSS